MLYWSFSPINIYQLQVLGVGCGNSRLEDNLLWWGVAAAGGTCIDRLAGNEEMLPWFGAVERRWLQTQSGDTQLPVIIFFILARCLGMDASIWWRSPPCQTDPWFGGARRRRWQPFYRRKGSRSSWRCWCHHHAQGWCKVGQVCIPGKVLNRFGI